ncbi:MAG: AAA family ATPase [Nannocystis sp.]|nr:AAA family ATPase [Nannocystis sp.]
MTSYVLWNNKGGVGKSTLAFHAACTHARLNPEGRTCVVDLSPQCDVSRMVLGGGLNDGEDVILNIMKRKPRATIYGYLSDCHNTVPTQGKWPKIESYLVRAGDERSPKAKKIPDNLYLLCGDFDLERIVDFMAQTQTPPLRGGLAPSGAQYSAALLIRSYLRKFVESITTPTTFFIDTDPYYNLATTHMGLLAADSWIAAYNPSSLASQFAVYRSIEYLYDQTHGLSRLLEVEKRNVPEEWYAANNTRIAAPMLKIPPLSMVVANNAKPYSTSATSTYTTATTLHTKAMETMEYEVRERVTRFNLDPQIVFQTVWNMQRLGHICDYNGIDIRAVRFGVSYTQPDDNTDYRLAGESTRKQVESYRENLKELVNHLP